MENYSKIELDTKDAQSFINALSTLYILQKELDQLDWTGEFHSDDQEITEHLINSLRNIIMKKIIIIDHD